jgi:hypothetical protein
VSVEFETSKTSVNIYQETLRHIPKDEVKIDFLAYIRDQHNSYIRSLILQELN